MQEWVVPIVCAAIALAGGLYATRGKRATDRGDLADRLWDQLQETDAAREEARRRYVARDLRWSDYVVRLRRQVAALGGDPEPYPDELTR